MFLLHANYVLHSFENKMTDEQTWQLGLPALFDVGHTVNLA